MCPDAESNVGGVTIADRSRIVQVVVN